MKLMMKWRQEADAQKQHQTVDVPRLSAAIRRPSRQQLLVVLPLAGSREPRGFLL